MSCQKSALSGDVQMAFAVGYYLADDSLPWKKNFSLLCQEHGWLVGMGPEGRTIGGGRCVEKSF